GNSACPSRRDALSGAHGRRDVEPGCLRGPDPGASTPTLSRPGSNHYRLRPFLFHSDVSRPAARQVKQRGDFSYPDRGGHPTPPLNKLTHGLTMNWRISGGGPAPHINN